MVQSIVPTPAPGRGYSPAFAQQRAAVAAARRAWGVQQGILPPPAAPSAAPSEAASPVDWWSGALAWGEAGIAGLLGHDEPVQDDGGAAPAPAPATGNVAAARRALESARAEADRLADQANSEAKTGRGAGWDKIEAARVAAVARVEKKEAELQQALDQERRHSPVQQIRQVALKVGAPLAGIVIGKKVFAPAIEGRVQASVAAKNTRLAEVAKDIDKALKMAPGAERAARLKGLLSAADKLKAGRARSVLGAGVAGILIGEGLYVRHYADGLEDETAREVTSAAGMTLTFTGTALVAERMVKTAAPTAEINAAALGRVEAARALLASGAAPGRQVLGAADLRGMRVDQLREVARQRGIGGVSRLRKTELTAKLAREMGGGAKGAARAAARAGAGGKAGVALALGAGVLGAAAAFSGGQAQAAPARTGRGSLNGSTQGSADGEGARRAPVRAAAGGEGRRMAYRRRDGEMVTGTAAQIRAWRRR